MFVGSFIIFLEVLIDLAKTVICWKPLAFCPPPRLYVKQILIDGEWFAETALLFIIWLLFFYILHIHVLLNILHCVEVHWTLPAIFPLSPDHSSTRKSTLHTSSVFTYSTTLSPPSSFKVRLLHKRDFFGNTKSQTKNMPEFVLIFSWSANTKLMKVFLKTISLNDWDWQNIFLTPYHPLI